jgi:archaellum component FlaC
MQEIINEKSRLENEYQKLNTVYEQTTNEQNDLLVLCSTYEDQLKICRNLIQSAGLTVKKFIEKKNFFCFFFY